MGRCRWWERFSDDDGGLVVLRKAVTAVGDPDTSGRSGKAVSPLRSATALHEDLVWGQGDVVIGEELIQDG